MAPDSSYSSNNRPFLLISGEKYPYMTGIKAIIIVFGLNRL